MNRYDKEETNIAPYSQFGAVQYCVMGSDEVKKLHSYVNITNKEILKGNIPMAEGIYDAHMGTTDHEWMCQTCGNRKPVCPGHFGSIDLKYPVKSPLYRDEIIKWLRIVCYHCGGFVISMDKIATKKTSNKLRQAVKEARAVKECPHCGKKHLYVNKDSQKTNLFYREEEERDNVRRYDLYNHDILRVLESIPDEAVEAMGKPAVSHPKKYILTSILVPPNTIRPDMRRAGGSHSTTSDTTALLKTIVEINNSLENTIPKEISHETKDSYLNLDMTYAALVKGGGGGEVKILTNTNQDPISIAGRLTKKNGRIRNNLMGKRVQFMIRSVITGDANLKIHEVGIPLKHAIDIEIPETVTEKNKDKMMIYFLNKTNKYPGCKRIVKKSDNHTYKVELLDPNYQLQVGDIVMRNMITGDYVCMNRQPSLWFGSIIGMRVVVMEQGKTIRINPSICRPFNADFDGDNMNALVAQFIQSIVDCRETSRASKWFISPQTVAPLMGAYFDGLAGISELTKFGIGLDKWHAMAITSDIDNPNLSFIFSKKMYTNREMVSLLLPHINVIGREPTFFKSNLAAFIKYNPEDIKVEIIRGQLKSGVLDKGTMGQEVAGSIFHIIGNEFGNDAALSCIYDFQRLTHKYFLYNGFTTGIRDIIIPEDIIDKIRLAIKNMILESYRITDMLNKGKLIAPLGVSLRDYYEVMQMNALTNGNDIVEYIMSNIDPYKNGLCKMIFSGSKGGMENFISLLALVGTQQISGKRFPYQVGWGRTSPYFTRHDTDPISLGFIPNCYREGVDNSMYPFFSAEGRQGQISNALSTSVAGYQNRISTKNLESIIADNHRKSVKSNNLVQPLYAELGVAVNKMEKVKFPSIMISDTVFDEQYLTKVDVVDQKYRNKSVEKILEEEYAQLKQDRRTFREIFMQLENNNPNEFVMTDVRHMPVNIGRIIDDTAYNYAELKDSGVLDPVYTTESVKKLCENISYCFLNEIQEKKGTPIPAYMKMATKMLGILVRSHMNIKNLVKKGINNILLDIIIQKIKVVFQKSLVEYGTPVGILAVQCITEPMTQFVLNSKHRTGGVGGTQTSGLVRIQELLGVRGTDKMKNPHMTIMVKEEFEENKVKVQEIANQIEMMRLEQFIDNVHIFFEEFGKPTHPDFQEEKVQLETIIKHSFGQRIPNNLVNWCIRFSINREELIIKGIKLETITYALRFEHPELFVIYSPENSKNIFIRCYVKNVYSKDTTNYFGDYIFPLMSKLKKVIVRGVKNIISTDIVTVSRSRVKPDGSVENYKAFAIYTTGSNMREILNNPNIDPYRTHTDSIEEIESIFGINAARQKIINELCSAMPNKFVKAHTTIFADEMTSTGTITSIQKTGLARRGAPDVGLRVSFQTPIQILKEAASEALLDPLSGGWSSKLMFGATPKYGTTYNSVYVDTDAIKEFNKDMSKQIMDNIDDL